MAWEEIGKTGDGSPVLASPIEGEAVPAVAVGVATSRTPRGRREVWDELREAIIARAAYVGHYSPPDMVGAYVESSISEAVICCRAVLDDPETLINETRQRIGR